MNWKSTVNAVGRAIAASALYARVRPYVPTLITCSLLFGLLLLILPWYGALVALFFLVTFFSGPAHQARITWQLYRASRGPVPFDAAAYRQGASYASGYQAVCPKTESPHVSGDIVPPDEAASVYPTMNALQKQER